MLMLTGGVGGNEHAALVYLIALQLLKSVYH